MSPMLRISSIFRRGSDSSHFRPLANMKYSECVCDFSFMIVIYLFLAFPKFTESLSHTILGKSLAILLIVIYSAYDILYGLFFCLLVIIYYYHNGPEASSLPIYESFQDGLLYEYQLDSGKTDDFYSPGALPLPQSYGYMVPKDASSSSDMKPPHRDATETDFIKQNCPNGNLTKKNGLFGDFRVPSEMAEHIYPEIVYPGTPCNPCSSQCAFKIKEKQLKAEDEIMLPKNSNDWFDAIMARFEN